MAGVDLGANNAELLCTVLGNGALIEGVLNNLLDNALRYGLASEEAKRITVALVDNPQSAVLSVFDNGPGVSKAHLQKLSKRWVQDAAGEALKEGLGLGLAIVKAYVSLMGAKLQLDNETPHGLRVSVTFPKP